MPELPEVEVTRLGIAGHLVGARVTRVAIHSAKLRHTVPEDLPALLRGQTVHSVERRGKYLILRFGSGSLLLHLGMTGHLRLLPVTRAAGAHDHLDVHFDSGLLLRMNDVRRFGSVHWSCDDPLQHKLLKDIGPEPLSEAFCAGYLLHKSRGKRVAVQKFLMDSTVVAGIGNIYAAESLFRSGILPTTPAGDLSPDDCARIVAAIKEVLSLSIATGHSTMDFTREEERLSYFPQQLFVYNREGKPCRRCGAVIQRGRLGNRSSYFCPCCQH